MQNVYMNIINILLKLILIYLQLYLLVVLLNKGCIFLEVLLNYKNINTFCSNSKCLLK